MINEQRQKLQDEAFEALKKSGFNGGIIMPTGSGKTFVLIKSVLALPEKYNILYCCDNRNLRDKDFPSEVKLRGAESILKRMERLCYKSAYKLKNKTYDILLLDEGDYCLTPEYVKLLENNKFKHIIFASATLEADKKKILKNFVPIVYEKEVKDVEDGGVINKANLYFVNYMLNRAENSKYLAYNEVFKRLLNEGRIDRARVDAVVRNRKLFLSGLDSSRRACQNLASKLYDDKKNKILIFCTLSDQADKVCKYSYHGKNDKDNPYIELYRDNKLRIMAVVGKIDRGTNIDGVNTVIFESPGESRTKAVQKSGRARRLDVESISNFYFLVPFYRDRHGSTKPTIVQKWVLNSTKDFNQNFKIINL